MAQPLPELSPSALRCDGDRYRVRRVLARSAAERGVLAVGTRHSTGDRVERVREGVTVCYSATDAGLRQRIIANRRPATIGDALFIAVDDSNAKYPLEIDSYLVSEESNLIADTDR